MVRIRHVRSNMEKQQRPRGPRRGAPPGLRGLTRRGGQLDRGRPAAAPTGVILLDEIRERPTPTFFNTLLRCSDDGRLTDGQGPHRRLQETSS